MKAARQLLAAVGPVAVALLWLRYEIAHASSSATAIGGGFVLGPGRFYLAYAVFLFASAIVPSILLLQGLLSRPRGRRSPWVTAAVWALATILPAAAAGYSYDGLTTRVVVGDVGVTYRRAGATQTVAWADVQWVHLQMRGGAQTLQLVDGRRAIAVDLGVFTPHDRLMLVRAAARFADLGLVRRTPSDWVWRRLQQVQPPTAPSP